MLKYYYNTLTKNNIVFLLMILEFILPLILLKFLVPNGEKNNPHRPKIKEVKLCLTS